MSWNSYLDNMAGQCQANMDTGAIIGHNGASWTDSSSPRHLAITDSESKTIGQAMSSKQFEVFQTSGVKIAGVKYQFLRDADDGKIVLAKKKGEGAITMQSTKTAVVIAHVEEGKQQGAVNKGVAVIAEYLESLNM